MPSRILKESICTSETIDRLSWGAEVFFYRLLVQCDDYGRYDARPGVLRGHCYPLRLETVSEADVRGWLDELVQAELVWLYEVDGVPYLQVTRWDRHQRIRAKRSRCPAPPSAGGESDTEPAGQTAAGGECGAATRVLREVTGVAPPVAWCEQIEAAVGEGEAELARWRETVMAWLGCGWSPRNVKGMLEYFMRNAIPGRKAEYGRVEGDQLARVSASVIPTGVANREQWESAEPAADVDERAAHENGA